MLDVAAIDDGLLLGNGGFQSLRGGGGFVVGGGGLVVIFCSGLIGTTGFSGFSVDKIGGQIRFSNLTKHPHPVVTTVLSQNVFTQASQILKEYKNFL